MDVNSEFSRRSRHALARSPEAKNGSVPRRSALSLASTAAAGALLAGNAAAAESFTVSARVTPTDVGGAVQVEQIVTAASTISKPVIVLEIRDATGTRVAQQTYDGYDLWGGNPTSYYQNFRPTEAGRYTIGLTIRAASGGKALYRNDKVATFTVGTRSTLADHTPTGGYHVDGPSIIGPDGSPFIPRGFNVGGNTFANGGVYPDRSLDGAFFTYLSSLGANTIRLVGYGTSRHSYALAANGNSYKGDSKIAGELSYLEDAVAAVRAAGMVTIVEFHDFTDAFSPSEQASESKWRQELASTWTGVADAFKGQSDVWFNTGNEPCYASSDWVKWQTQMLEAIRGTGAQNIAVLDAPFNGGDTGHLQSSPRVFEPSMGPTLSRQFGQIVISQHNYGAYDAYTTQSEYDAYIDAVHDAGLAIFHGEIGAPYDGSGYAAQNTAGVKTALTGKAKGVGALWWATNFNDGYRLHADGSDLTPENASKPFTDTGNSFLDYLKSF